MTSGLWHGVYSKKIGFRLFRCGGQLYSVMEWVERVERVECMTIVVRKNEYLLPLFPLVKDQ